jgi:N-acetylmuramoyl-L-alanine amidase
MKFQWLLLLSSLSSIFLFSSPSEAAELLRWRFDANRNQLVFVTDDSVQPKAQLYTNPSRLIIDLPGTTLERRTVNQQSRGAIESIRVGQYDSRTTRIVVELAPGYTIDPQQVQFESTSPSEWSVQIPTPQRVAESSRTTPAIVAIAVPRASTPSNDQGDSTPSNEESSSLSETTTPASRFATIEAVEFANDGNQLLIRADQSVRATSRWNSRANAYQITIPNARLADRVRGPQLDATSPISQVILRQQTPRTVIVLVKPGTSRIGELNQISDRLLALQLLQTRAALPPSGLIPVPPPNRIPVPSPNRIPVPPPNRTMGLDPLSRSSRLPYGRLVVTIDPGHGGKDPGAIGLGGLREKDVILPIAQQVAALLEQQGIQVVMTRYDDRFISLAGRVLMAQRSRSSLFVSIHANAAGSRRPNVNGLETYYYSSGAGLAQAIHYSILQSVNIQDRRVRQARFYVLRYNSIPSVLVETGYLTGAEDVRKLASPIFQRQMAEAIARGILLYIQQNR